MDGTPEPASSHSMDNEHGSQGSVTHDQGVDCILSSLCPFAAYVNSVVWGLDSQALRRFSAIICSTHIEDDTIAFASIWLDLFQLGSEHAGQCLDCFALDVRCSACLESTTNGQETLQAPQFESCWS